jgi:hypothetical protein
MKYGVLTKFNSSTRRIRWPSELAQNPTLREPAGAYET